MKDNQCVSRLLASSLHDMRNVLAIIRESAGLAQDVSAIAGQAAESADSNREILLSSLQSVQSSVVHGAALVEAMDDMAQLESQKNAPNPTCDLSRVCRSFCCMAARWAKGVRIQLAAQESSEAVWAAMPASAAYCALLDILDLCASVGGQVSLNFTAAHWNKKEGILVELAGGENLALVLAAMTGNPALESSAPDWQATLVSCHDAGQRFFLSLSAAGTAGN